MRIVSIPVVAALSTAAGVVVLTRSNPGHHASTSRDHQVQVSANPIVGYGAPQRRSASHHHTSLPVCVVVASSARSATVRCTLSWRWVKKHPRRSTGWNNPHYDHLWQRQSVTVDVAKRRQIVWQMEAYEAQQRPNIQLVDTDELTAYKDTWSGFEPALGGYYTAPRPAS
jgi:ABC-type transport system substrate-binding protein